MSRMCLVILSVACSIGCPIWVHAATITQTQGFTGNPSIHKTVEFDRFNPARGQLTSAEWRFILEIDGGEYIIDNDTLASKEMAVILGARGSLTSHDVVLSDNEMQPILSGERSPVTATQTTLHLEADDGDGGQFEMTGPDAAVYHGSFASTQASAFVNSSDLDGYVGTELFQLSVAIEQVAPLNLDGSFSSFVTPVTAMPNVVLIYEFTPIPEPNGILLSCIALCGVMTRTRLLRRRSR